MRIAVKIALCALLMLLAAWSLLAVLDSIGAVPASAQGQEDDGYMIREYEGYVAVWYPAQANYPAMITEIRTGDLPLTDRVGLRDGIPASDRDEVMRLLEDFAA